MNNTNLSDNIKLFSITEFSRACGLSRASLLRLEECGILTPCKVDQKTGYRYYDALNVTEAGQYQLMQIFGLSRAEIADYLTNRLDSKKFLKQQRDRVNRMLCVLDELELRHDKSNNIRFSFLDLPEVTCYCAKVNLANIDEGVFFYTKLIEECVMAGYKIAMEEHLFGIRADDFKKGMSESIIEEENLACVPVVAKNPDDPNLITFPSVHTFSALAYGNFSVTHELCKRFWEEIAARNLKPTGPARFIGVVAPYIRKTISPDDYCYRLVIPVESITHRL